MGHTIGKAVFFKVSEVLVEVGLKWEDCVGFVLTEQQQC